VYLFLTTSKRTELLPTPLPQTPHGHLTTFCVTFCHSSLITTLVLFMFTLIPLFSMLSFHSLSLLIRSSSVTAISAIPCVNNSMTHHILKGCGYNDTTRSSACNNSHGKATLNSLDKASTTITNSKGLNAASWCIPSFTSKPLLLPCYSNTYTHKCTTSEKTTIRN